MNDLINSFKAQLYDRVTSPLLSSFLISWVVWNHRLFLVSTTSDMKLKERFDFIDNVLYPTWHEVLGRGFTFPLLSALFLLFVYPIPGRLVYKYVRSEQKRLKGIQQKIDDETPITQEQAKELRAAIRKADTDFQSEIEAKNEVIERLRSELAEIKLQSSEKAGSDNVGDELENKPQTDQVMLEDNQYELLRIISNRPGGLPDREILPLHVKNQLVGQYAIDELIRHQFIIRASVGNERGYKATAAGRAYVIAKERSLLSAVAG